MTCEVLEYLITLQSLGGSNVHMSYFANGQKNLKKMILEQDV